MPQFVARPGSRWRRLTAAVVILACVQTIAAAAPLADYKKRVRQARIVADDLYERLGEVDELFVTASVNEITRMLPAAEEVETAAGRVETNNAWLHEKLDFFSEERHGSGRGEILTEIGERLSSIHQSVEELEAAAASEQSKDADKQKLAEILRRDEYQKPQPQEPSRFQKWLNDFLEWLARMFPRAPVSEPTGSLGFGSLQFWLQVLVYVLAIVLVGFPIYKFAPFFVRRFRGTKRSKNVDRVILGERVGGDQSAHDLFSQAERLAREGDLRAAIRKGYIALLCDLGDRNVLRLARHKTNRDYLRDVRKNQVLFDDVSGLTLNFETTWYGLRSPEEADWEEFRSRYRQAMGHAK